MDYNQRDECIRALIEAIARADGNGRQKGRETMARMGAVAIPALIEAAKTENEDVRECAFLTLIMMGEKALPAIAQLMKSEDRFVKLSAMTAMLIMQKDMGGEVVETKRFSKRPPKIYSIPAPRSKVA